MAWELEKVLKNEQTGELSNLLERFESHLKPVMQSLESMETGRTEKSESNEISDQGSIGNAVVGPITNELFDLMESDLVEANNRLKDLAGHLVNSILGEQFKKLENQMDMFDIPAALDTLKEIASRLELDIP